MERFLRTNNINQVVTNPHMCIETWGKVIRERLDILESWAHKQGLELAAECHLAKINQCADFLQVIFSNQFNKQFRCTYINFNEKLTNIYSRDFTGGQDMRRRCTKIGMLVFPFKFTTNGCIVVTRKNTQKFNRYCYSYG